MATIFSIFRRSEGLEEIIFKDRNKEYGSYALRKEQNASLNQSSLITFGITLFICILLISHGKRNTVKVEKEEKTVIATFTKPNIEIPVFKLPSPPDWVQHVKKSAFIDPVIVDKLTDPASTMEPSSVIPTTIVDIDPQNTAGNTIQDPVPIEETKFSLFVPEMPRFNNGNLIEFSKWVQKSIVYPQGAIDREIEGRVTTEFIIGTVGKIEEIKVIRGIDSLLDNEAIRVLRKSPLWKPGKQNGDAVRVKLVLPIIFQLGR